jgi:hypothetical protein
MTHEYIARMYRAGQDMEARRAIRAEIIREHTPEGEAPTYEPEQSEVYAVEAEYYAARRKRQYGPWDQQLEEIYEQGEQAWRDRIAQVKAAIPKP